MTAYKYSHRVEGTCPACGFDDIWEVHIYDLGDDGITRTAYTRACVRCWRRNHG